MNTAQHFVPQFYLRQWGDRREHVWQYSVKGGKPWNPHVRNVAFQRGLYSHPAADKKPVLETEEDLAKLEGLYGSEWPRIIDRAESPETRKNFARFVALMAVRNPRYEGNVARLNAKLRAAVKELSPDEMVEFLTPNGETAACKVQDILDGTQDEKDVIKSGFLRLMRHQVEPISEAMFKRPWGVVFSNRPAFLTSDCPVVLDRGKSRKAGFGYGTPGTLILFPVCPTRLLVIDDEWPHPFAHYKLTNSDVFNRIIAEHAERFVYGADSLADLPSKLQLWRGVVEQGQK